MTDDTRNCDDVAEYLEGITRTERRGVVIQTKNNGEISESVFGQGQGRAGETAQYRRMRLTDGQPVQGHRLGDGCSKGVGRENVALSWACAPMPLRATSFPSRRWAGFTQDVSRRCGKSSSAWSARMPSWTSWNPFRAEGVVLERKGYGRRDRAEDSAGSGDRQRKCQKRHRRRWTLKSRC